MQERILTYSGEELLLWFMINTAVTELTRFVNQGDVPVSSPFNPVSETAEITISISGYDEGSGVLTRNVAITREGQELAHAHCGIRKTERGFVPRFVVYSDPDLFGDVKFDEYGGVFHVGRVRLLKASPKKASA